MRILAILAIAGSLVGCATGASPVEPHRVGASKNTGASETINLGATVRSLPQPVNAYDNIGFAIFSTGTSAGAWTVQYSNSFILGVDDPTSDVKWDTYTLTTTPPAAAGSAQTFGIVLDSFEYAWVRIKYTYTSGAGSATIITQLKGN